jgi:hypothetical protein
MGKLWAMHNRENWDARCKQRDAIWIGIEESVSINVGLS